MPLHAIVEPPKKNPRIELETERPITTAPSENAIAAGTPLTQEKKSQADVPIKPLQATESLPQSFTKAKVELQQAAILLPSEDAQSMRRDMRCAQPTRLSYL
jgi:hypothetical protein